MSDATRLFRKFGILSYTLFIIMLFSVSVVVHAATKNSLIAHQEHPSESMITIKSSSLTISGWAVAEDGIKTVSVLMDGKLMGYATYGGVRKDVHTAYPALPDSIHSGYSYVLKGIRYGKHEVVTVATSKLGVSRTIARFLVDRRFPISFKHGVKIVIALIFLTLVFFAVRKMFRTRG